MPSAKRLGALSVASGDLDLIKRQLEQIKAKLPQPWSFAGSEAEADVLLIDVDSVYGHMDWLRAHAQGRDIIAISERTHPDHPVTFLRPLTPDGLLGALAKFSGDGAARAPAAAPAATATPTPAAAKSAPAAAAPIAHVPLPDELPLSEFCTREALPNPARLVRGDQPALTIDMATDTYYGPATLKPLIPYCQGMIARQEWQPVSASVMEGLRAAGGGLPLSRLLWLYTLVNSAGHLIPGLDVNGRYKLAKWPQIEREFPRHFRIATVMMKGPQTLSSIAEQSGATLADVIDFVNAYYVTGHAEPEGVGLAAPQVAHDATGMGQVLARLRGRVKRA
jgi:hypothetical protein